MQNRLSTEEASEAEHNHKSDKKMSIIIDERRGLIEAVSAAVNAGNGDREAKLSKMVRIL